MTNRWVSFLVSSLVCVLCCAADRDSIQQVFKNDQGELGYNSFVTKTDGAYKYEIWIQYNGPGEGRVYWQSGNANWGYNWVAPKEPQNVLSITSTIEPHKQDGVIRFFGGRMGESINNTLAYFPEEGRGTPAAPSRVVAESTLRIRKGAGEPATYYELVVIGESTPQSEKAPFRMAYTLRIKGIENLPSDGFVRWDSIVSDEFLSAYKDSKDGVLPLNRLDGGQFRTTVVTDRAPVMRIQTLRLWDAKRRMVAQAILPALAAPPLKNTMGSPNR